MSFFKNALLNSGHWTYDVALSPNYDLFDHRYGRGTGRVADIHEYPLPFGREARARPMPSDPHYDAEARELCEARKGLGRVLFWNVAGPAMR